MLGEEHERALARILLPHEDQRYLQGEELQSDRGFQSASIRQGRQPVSSNQSGCAISWTASKRSPSKRNSSNQYSNSRASRHELVFYFY